jgi:zinc transporter ZupT
MALALAIIGAGTFAGGLVPLLRRWSEETISILLAFGSGVILAVIFIQMLPAVFAMAGPWGGGSVLAGFVFTSLLEAEMHAHRHTGHGEEAAGLRLAGGAVAAGLALHALMDGLVLGTGLSLADLASPVFFAILVHKGPDAFALSTVLVAAGLSTGRILGLLAAFSLATPVAALAAVALLRPLPGAALGMALGAAAGTLLAVASEDLLPEVHRRGGRTFLASAAALAGGIGIVALWELWLH